MSTTVQSGTGHPPTGLARRPLTRRVHYLPGLAIGPFLVVRGSQNSSADVRGPSLVQLEPRVGVGVALATVLVAWAMPVLGVTLVGFLLLDVAVSRSRRTAPVSQRR